MSFLPETFFRVVHTKQEINRVKEFPKTIDAHPLCFADNSQGRGFIRFLQDNYVFLIKDCIEKNMKRIVLISKKR